jgi:hypothetical protein
VEKKDKKTAGQVFNELVRQDVYGDITAGERMREMLGEYESHVHDAVHRGKKLYTGNFFVDVLTKRERIMSTHFRNYFIPRQTCPTPHLEQSVFMYNAKSDRIEYMWSLPDASAVRLMIKNKKILDPQMLQLLQFVLDFASGHLDKKAMSLNNEGLIITN